MFFLSISGAKCYRQTAILLCFKIKSVVNYLWIQSHSVDVSGHITFREASERKHAKRIQFSIHLLYKNVALLLFLVRSLIVCVCSRLHCFYFLVSKIFFLASKKFSMQNKRAKKLQSERGINSSFLWLFVSRAPRCFVNVNIIVMK